MERQEFDQIVEQERRRLLRVAENLVGPEAAADVVQDALLSVFKDGQWNRGVRDVSKWLTTAVQNAAKMHLRTSGRDCEQEATYSLGIDHDAPTEDDLAQKVDLERALAKLPDEIRAAVVAVVIEGATVREHGADVGVSHDTAHQRVQRGLAFLKACLTNDPSAASTDRE